MEIDGNNRKRTKKTLCRDEEVESSFALGGIGSPCSTLQNGFQGLDRELFNYSLPNEFETLFATAIFELGLKHSSPKVLIPFMPPDSGLSTEHIKSHLQKYRIHKSRSKEEFCNYFDSSIKDSFHQWDQNKLWEEVLNLSQPTISVLADGNPTGTVIGGNVLSGNVSSGGLDGKQPVASSTSSNGRVKGSLHKQPHPGKNSQQQNVLRKQQDLSKKKAKEDELNRNLQTLVQVHHSLAQINMQVHQELQTFLPSDPYSTTVRIAPVPAVIFPPEVGPPIIHSSATTFPDLFSGSRNGSVDNLLVDDGVFNSNM